MNEVEMPGGGDHPRRFLSELLRHLPDASLLAADESQAGQILVERVTADSRAVEPGACFVAVAGLRLDGHRFIPEAVEDGACAIVGTRSLAELKAVGVMLPPEVPYVQVANSRKALAVLCAALNDFPSRSMTVIGVTGTDGKTTTSTLIESILAVATRTDAPVDAGPQLAESLGAVGVITTLGARFRGVEQDTGFHVTTPDAPQVQSFLAGMRDAGCRYAIVEATSHGLDQDRLWAVDFDVAAVTNITHEHLDYHGNLENYVAAKALLFRSLFHTPAKPGVARCAVLNGDDPVSFPALQAVLAEEAAAGDVPPVVARTYGLGTAVDVTARNLRYDPDMTRFELHWWGGVLPVETRLIGEFNVYNILCAATVTLGLGVDPRAVQEGIARLQGVLGRMQRIDRGQSFLAVVDFAHSPGSLERALQTLRPLVGQDSNGRPGRLIAVFGCAGLRDRAKRRLMGQVSGRLADFTIITAEDPRTEDLDAINREIEAGVLEYATSDKYTIVPDRGDAIRLAVEMARSGDVVAAFGKGHERTMCFGETEYPWSDQQAMIHALEWKQGRPSIV